MNEESTLSGWWVFAGILLLIAGVLNIIWGIAAIGNSKFFTENATYIVSSLHTWGWVTLIIGVLELVAAFSLFSGGEFGRWFGIFIASLNAIGALLSIPAYPFWSLAVFALSIIVVYKLAEGPRALLPDRGFAATATSRRPRDPGAFVVPGPAVVEPATRGEWRAAPGNKPRLRRRRLGLRCRLPASTRAPARGGSPRRPRRCRRAGRPSRGGAG